MTASTIPTKSFLKAMALPDDQRRKVLEKLGAKLMVQLKIESESRQNGYVSSNLVADSN